MKKCIIVGAGTYGQVYTEYLKDDYDILGFIDDNIEPKTEIINSLKVLGDFEYLKKEFINTKISVFVPIGNNKVRVSILDELNNLGFETPNYIHPTAEIHSSVILGKGVYVLANSFIMPLTVLEDYVMVSMGVNIAHHTKIEKGCFMSQGTNIGASMNLRERAYIGIGATIMTGMKEIGRDTLIGAGAVVIRDVPDNAVVVGNPGRIIKYKQ